MREACDGLYDIIRLLLPHNTTARIKKAALYLTIVDQDGKAARITFEDELVIYPYKAAADHYQPATHPNNQGRHPYKPPIP